MKPAACRHHFLTIGVPVHVAPEGTQEAQLKVTLGCILCFKYTEAVFRPLGYRVDAKTRRLGS